MSLSRQSNHAFQRELDSALQPAEWMFQAVNRRESKSLANAATNGNLCGDSMPVILGTSELQASNLLSTLKYHDDTPPHYATGRVII
jgi:Tfp pilus assembly protein PilX